MRDLYIYGAGEFAEIASCYFEDEAKYNLKGFVVDDEFAKNSQSMLNGLPVAKRSEVISFLTKSNVDVFVAISATSLNTKRESVFRELKSIGCTFAKYISPFSFVSRKAVVGENVFIFEENVIQLGVSIGDNTVLWSGNHIGHRTKIGSHVFLSSHVVISGFCTIGNNCYFGVNSTVVDRVNVSNATFVGAGSLVLKDTDANSVYFGSPAKKIIGRDPFVIDL